VLIDRPFGFEFSGRRRCFSAVINTESVVKDMSISISMRKLSSVYAIGMVQKQGGHALPGCFPYCLG
jgi:hypothetical protein